MPSCFLSNKLPLVADDCMPPPPDDKTLAKCSSLSNSICMPESPLLHLSRRLYFVLRLSFEVRHTKGPNLYLLLTAPVLQPSVTSVCISVSVINNAVESAAAFAPTFVVVVVAVCGVVVADDDEAAAVWFEATGCWCLLKLVNVRLNFCKTPTFCVATTAVALEELLEEEEEEEVDVAAVLLLLAVWLSSWLVVVYDELLEGTLWWTRALLSSNIAFVAAAAVVASVVRDGLETARIWWD